MPARSLLLFTLFIGLVLALLVGLGVWQLERREWKEALITKIEARVKAGPVGLDEAIAKAGRGEDVAYLRVRVEGRFAHEEERYLYALSGNEPGWRVITPLKAQDGVTVLVDRGFVPNGLKAPSSRRQGQIEGNIGVTGLVRPPEQQGLFTPDNAPSENRWFWRDFAAIRASMPASLDTGLAPFFIEAEAKPVPGGWPRGGETRLAFPNDHLQYALTWFLLAGCLLGVYLVYLRSRQRRGDGGPHVATEGPDG